MDFEGIPVESYAKGETAVRHQHGRRRVQRHPQIHPARHREPRGRRGPRGRDPVGEGHHPDPHPERRVLPGADPLARRKLRQRAVPDAHRGPQAARAARLARSRRARATSATILVLSGPNLQLLGTREPASTARDARADPRGASRSGAASRGAQGRLPPVEPRRRAPRLDGRRAEPRASPGFSSTRARTRTPPSRSTTRCAPWTCRPSRFTSRTPRSARPSGAVRASRRRAWARSRASAGARTRSRSRPPRSPRRDALNMRRARDASPRLRCATP